MVAWSHVGRMLAAISLVSIAPALVALVPSRSCAVEIIGHRGASHDAPENTLASFNLAWSQNADAAELDVYLSKDGQVVVFHDKTTNRIGGRDRRVVDQTLAELKQLDIGRWKGEKWAGERIPTLDQVLSTIPKGKRLFVEIKCGPEIVPTLAQVVQQSSKGPAQVCFISFSYDVVEQLKRELPKYKSYWIVELKSDKRTGKAPAVSRIIAKAKQAHLDGIDFGKSPRLDAELVGTVKKAGLDVIVWTVDSVQEARALERAGVDGITTNRPGYLKGHLKQRS